MCKCFVLLMRLHQDRPLYRADPHNMISLFLSNLVRMYLQYNLTRDPNEKCLKAHFNVWNMDYTVKNMQ